MTVRLSSVKCISCAKLCFTHERTLTFTDLPIKEPIYKQIRWI